MEARLVSLTSAQKTTDDELDKIETRLEEAEQLLEGDPLKREDSGLKGDVKELNVGLNALRAIMAPDQFGNGGVRNRLDALEEALGLRVQTSKYRWLFILGIISASSAVTVAIVENLDRIVGVYSQLTHSKPPSKKSSKKHGSLKKPRRPPPQEDDEPAADEVPAVR